MPAENKSLRRCKYFIRFFRLGDFNIIVCSHLLRIRSIASHFSYYHRRYFTSSVQIELSILREIVRMLFLSPGCCTCIVAFYVYC